jgi:hypothetical protein
MKFPFSDSGRAEKIKKKKNEPTIRMLSKLKMCPL